MKMSICEYNESKDSTNDWTLWLNIWRKTFQSNNAEPHAKAQIFSRQNKPNNQTNSIETICPSAMQLQQPETTSNEDIFFL